MCPEDLFGQAFIDFHEGKRYRLKLERDDGYVDEQDLSVYFKDFEDFPEVERKALRHAKGRVLDIGVGAGRVALYLQRRGIEVVGIDISDKALEVSRQRGVRKLLKMSACDMRFRRNSFDTALAFCNNFGLCGDIDGVRGMLRKLHSMIREDGLFLAESIHPTKTTNRAHLKYHRANVARGKPPGQVTLREMYRGKVGSWWGLLMVTPAEMRELCERTGWIIEKTCRGTRAYVYVLRKS